MSDVPPGIAADWLEERGDVAGAAAVRLAACLAEAGRGSLHETLERAAASLMDAGEAGLGWAVLELGSRLLLLAAPGASPEPTRADSEIVFDDPERLLIARPRIRRALVDWAARHPVPAGWRVRFERGAGQVRMTIVVTARGGVLEWTAHVPEGQFRDDDGDARELVEILARMLGGMGNSVRSGPPGRRGVEARAVVGVATRRISLGGVSIPAGTVVTRDAGGLLMPFGVRGAPGLVARWFRDGWMRPARAMRADLGPGGGDG